MGRGREKNGRGGGARGGGKEGGKDRGGEADVENVANQLGNMHIVGDLWMSEMTPEEIAEEREKQQKRQKKADQAQRKQWLKEKKDRKQQAAYWERAKRYEQKILNGEDQFAGILVAGADAGLLDEAHQGSGQVSQTGGSSSSKKKKNTGGKWTPKDFVDEWRHLLDPEFLRNADRSGVYAWQSGLPLDQAQRQYIDIQPKDTEFDINEMQFHCKLCRNAKKKYPYFGREHFDSEEHRKKVAERKVAQDVLHHVLNNLHSKTGFKPFRPDSRPANSLFAPSGLKPYLVTKCVFDGDYMHTNVLRVHCLLCGSDHHDKDLTMEMVQKFSGENFGRYPFRMVDHDGDHESSKRHQKAVWAYHGDDPAHWPRDSHYANIRAEVEAARAELRQQDQHLYIDIGEEQEQICCSEVPAIEDGEVDEGPHSNGGGHQAEALAADSGSSSTAQVPPRHGWNYNYDEAEDVGSDDDTDSDYYSDSSHGSDYKENWETVKRKHAMDKK